MSRSERESNCKVARGTWPAGRGSGGSLGLACARSELARSLSCHSRDQRRVRASARTRSPEM
eukprot:scaffold2462_cov402-Prasinococcus_capsulatus_cf.AAC.16